MERIDNIMAHPLFVENRARIEALERDRVYCRHGIDHSLDVARILYIKVLENGWNIPKDLLYAAALLHDIGRGAESPNGAGHHEQGAELARRILPDCGFAASECEQITRAIAAHKEKQPDDILCKLLYEADKESRNCFDCEAAVSCYWDESKKNHGITY